MDSKYFKQAGDLTDSSEVEKGNNSDNYFKQAGDLTDSSEIEKGNNSDNYFKSASEYDLVDNYSSEIMSEFGSMIVSREKLYKMVEEGYNITSINKVGDLYSIEYEYDKENVEGRSR